MLYCASETAVLVCCGALRCSIFFVPALLQQATVKQTFMKQGDDLAALQDGALDCVEHANLLT